MMDPVDLLGDMSALRAADRAALLPAVATAGAQLRSTAARVGEVLDRVAGFDGESGMRPRAVVVIASGRAALDVSVAVALLGPRCPVPIVLASELPSWVGALDVVAVLVSDAQSGGTGVAESIQVARRRGAAVLVRASAGGEIAYAAGPCLFSPAIGVPEALAGGARLATLLLIAAACRMLPSGPSAGEIDVIADLLDAESLAFAPQVDTFVNPAKGLALHLMTGAGVLIGADPLGTALAGHGAWMLGEIAGRPSMAYSSEQISQAPALVNSMATRRDPFADPFDELLDDPDGLVRLALRPVIIRGREADSLGGAASWTSHNWFSSMQSALPTALTLDGPEMVLPLSDSGLRDSELGDSAQRDSGTRDSGTRDSWLQGGMRDSVPRSSTPRDHAPRDQAPRNYALGGAGSDHPSQRFLGKVATDWAAAALIMLRLDFAAVYLGIIAGQPVPVDAPAGLGAHAASRDLLRPDTVVMTTREQEDFDRWN